MSLLLSGMKRVACGAALASFHADALLMTHEDTLGVETGDSSEFDSYCRRKELMASLRMRERVAPRLQNSKKGTKSGRLRRPLCVRFF